ncbi:M28 family peptidase [Flavihumibacter petaseus]|uniref:Peptidase M28 family protein n=1 Tax=Flavihumibacter petaseus NBRC 106054 TaxID=1220578 RepID=A0A0E9MZ76_9BACT|nr:M28 family peptidase [Flavihumibacter petaseus]GAO42395.1 peptidase M28 family protein [Flavihumibacter petaseus NBRC 106054]
MRKLLFVLGLFPAALAIGQKKANPQKIAASITEEDLKRHLTIVAGADMEGRETATEGQKKAAAYIEQHFRSLGLLPGNKDSYQMNFPVFRDSLVSSKLAVNEQPFTVNTDYQPFLQVTRPGGQYFSEVVFAGHGIVDSAWDDYAGLEVRGKAVLLLDGVPSSYTTTKKGFRSPGNFYGKYLNAVKKGAAAVLLVGPNFPRKETPALGNMYTNLYSAEQPASLYTISAGLAKSLVGEDWSGLESGGKSGKVAGKVYSTRLMLELDKQIMKLSSSNVLGYLEGTDKKDEWLIITAHYDHLGKRGNVIYYGADDDGSGTVGVLEIAEAFVKAKAAGKGPRRNILFMTVSGEEKGLWGSEYFSEHPSIPMDKATADLNIDMIGRVDTERKTPDTLNYVYVVGDDKLSTELKPLSESINKKYVNMVLDYRFNDPNDQNQIYFRSDHYNFAKKGVPVIFYYDGMLQADYHKPTDTVDKIDFPLLKKRAQLVFYTAWEMANRDNQIKRDLPIPTMTRN